ncbi:hypothetical protein GCM10010435_96240 [Winogradskya consettensis]|uniref:Uncharacterized protein n=1 Tax=Winogradskya consettensis TaxID=113560 RepID=A0A919VXF6_9ACTN|nr:DUF6345 domain-containing protein [Actinoplanes consettensis]GIM79317.1 hypothetical protein Aco04nite_64870 [Actinoplanes consettensis]
MPIYTVVQEGLTAEQGGELARAFGTGNALQPNGYFSYVDTAYAQVPLTGAVTERGGEKGEKITAQTLDTEALQRIRPVADDQALERGAELVKLAQLSPDLTATPEVTHTELTITGTTGRTAKAKAKVYLLDTVVSYRLDLGGLPVTGQGAKLRLAVGPDGAVTQLTSALRQVEKSGKAEVISPRRAYAQCAALYGEGVKQDEPTLGYQFPELSAADASGKGTVSTILPQYTCNPADGAQAHRLVPAVEGAAPAGKIGAVRSGATISAKVSVEGGTAPYTYLWSSSSTVLTGRDEAGITYERSPRDREDGGEQLTVEVTDANGLAATAHVDLGSDGEASAEFQPGGGGFGALSTGRTDVGIEQTINEWQCAQDSANGFRTVMAGHGVPTQFDWRGASAFERDFKEPYDNSYVDDVDATWYTGHGWPGGFTFKGAHDDTSITPGDARWGNNDLEWLQLESCQVLRDTNGNHDYFGRWRQAFAGLHILNGFDTNAYCVGGGTGGTFASYLFPKKFLWWQLRPAYRVQSAWAAMAIDREPAGVKYRSMGLIRSDGVTNIGDYFWGQGPTGPDIPLTSSTGMWSLSGTV